MEYPAAPLFPNANGRPTKDSDWDARLVRWTLDLSDNTNRIKREPLDDLPGEFPRFDERRAGLSYRHGWFACRSRGPAERRSSTPWPISITTRASTSPITFRAAMGSASRSSYRAQQTRLKVAGGWFWWSIAVPRIAVTSWSSMRRIFPLVPSAAPKSHGAFPSASTATGDPRSVVEHAPDQGDSDTSMSIPSVNPRH
jgi:hypothetical protein